ncbi:MAG: hypothetical protein ABSC49_02450 [Candidatus Microgenomates bacterium]|jgi:predicted ferric reductase
MRKYIFFTIWIILLVLVPLTIFQTTPLAAVTKYPVTLMNFLQRFAGLIAYILLFEQIVMGAFLPRLIDKFGEWIFNFHILQGKLVYLLVLAHPVFFMFFNHFAGAGWNPYAVFINACLLCDTQIGYYYTLGMISFWLLTVTVFAVVFQNTSPWLRKNWKKMHVVNYIVFLLVGLHGFLLGIDFKVQPFYTFAVLAYVVILGIVVFIEIPRLYKACIKWLNS